MPKHQAILRCSQTAAFLIFVTIGILFTIAGCTAIYKTIGLTDDQAAAQVAADQAGAQELLHNLRTSLLSILLTTIAGAGTITSGILAKWLGTERKITKAIIKGVESNPTGDVKESIAAAATDAGVEKILHARVKALT